MNRHLPAVALALVAGACAGTTTSHAPQPPQAPLELRQAQTRTFETADPRLVLKAVVNVLQDQGFVIRQAEFELGLVTAVTEWRSGRRNEGLRILKWVAAFPTWGASLLLPAGRNEVSAIEAVVNVMPEAARTRVRLSLTARVTDDKGVVQRVNPVDDPASYQRLLASLDKALFLEKEGL
ncbi:MAG TPA: hypothetical protein VLL75_17165 [Vicinamibacteria bacterium]|nr:hypothetical protein [Vicinamibacteria bacterium]